MERAKCILLILFLLIVYGLFGQDQSFIYKAFIEGDMVAWQKEIDSLERLNCLDNEDKLELVNKQIGYIGWCVGAKRFEEAKKYLILSETHLKELSSENFEPSYVLSYKGSIDGLKIGINRFSAFFLGPGILSKARLSIELDCENPYGYILLGNSKYYMWAMLGGSKEGAISYYKKAEMLLEKENKTNQNWNYLSLLTIIAHAYVQMGKYGDANYYYKKILRIEPDYKWIKEEIYPHFLNDYEEK